MVVGDDLHLDVTRTGEEALDVQLGPAERRLRFALRRGQRFGDLVGPGDHPHAPTASAVHRLHGERPAELVAELADAVGLVDTEHRSRNRCYTGCGSDLSCRQLVAHHRDHVGGWSDERQRRGADGGGEGGAFGEEPIAGVHGVAPCLPGGADDPIDVQVGVGGSRSGEGDSTVGELHRHRVGIGLAVHDDGLDAEAVARPDHADGDLAAIGDEDAGDHQSLFTAGKLAHVRQVRDHVFTELAHRRSTIGTERRSERHVACSGVDEPAASLDDLIRRAADPQRQHLRREPRDPLGRVDGRADSTNVGSTPTRASTSGENEAP